MADVKVPALLHKMSVSSQKAWYNKHNMALPGHLTGGEGKSAAQAKKDVGEINKAKAKEDRLKVIAAAAKKVAQPSSERVRAMRQNADQFGGGLGGGLDRNRDIMSYVRSGGYIKAGRLGEETSLDEARVDHREFATAGIMHPDMAHAPRMKAGNYTDFYSRKNGNKLHGNILSNDKKTVRIEHEGKVHKFDVRRSMPTSMYKEDKDDREYGYEGDMAMSQLKSIIANSQKMHDMLEPDTDLPEWVQSKITLAEDYIVTAANYLQGEMNEESVKVFAKEEQTEMKDSTTMIEAKRILGLLRKEEVEAGMQFIEERLKSSDPAAKWIQDFVKSDNPKFKGKSKEERIRMALGAKYASKRRAEGVAEEAEQTDEARKMSRIEWRTGTPSDIAKNHEKIYKKLLATDPSKAQKFLNSMKKKDVKEAADPGKIKVVNKEVKTNKAAAAADKIVKVSKSKVNKVNMDPELNQDVKQSSRY